MKVIKHWHYPAVCVSCRPELPLLRGFHILFIKSIPDWLDDFDILGVPFWCDDELQPNSRALRMVTQHPL